MGRNLKAERLGEERLNNNGCLMKIVAYNKTTDIIVEFQDEHKARVHGNYYNFIHGGIENPYNKKIANREERLGEEAYSNSGELMKIVEYNNSKNIIVEFQDENKHRVKTSYGHFLGGEVKNRGKNIGETNINCQGETMTIIKYDNNMNVLVKFDKTGSTKICRYDSFKNGQVKDNYFKEIYGVACIGNAVTIDENGNRKRSYETWVNMLNRCYNEKSFIKYPTYSDCTVCDEWLCYENFERWYNENYYQVDDETMQLDKDILVKGNRVYSPDTCTFVPQRINSLISVNKSVRGDYPIGVHRVKGYEKYKATISDCCKIKATYHNTPEEAYCAYKEGKESLIKRVADEYRDKIPSKLYDALYAYKIDITD